MATPHLNTLLGKLSPEDKEIIKKHLGYFVIGHRGPKHLLLTGPAACGKSTVARVAAALSKKEQVEYLGSYANHIEGLVTIVSNGEAPQHNTCIPFVEERVVSFSVTGGMVTTKCNWEQMPGSVLVQKPCIAILKNRERGMAQVLEVLKQLGPSSPILTPDVPPLTIIPRKARRRIACFEWRAPIIAVGNIDPSLLQDKWWDKVEMPAVPQREWDMQLLHKVQGELKQVAAVCFAAMIAAGGPDGTSVGAATIAARLAAPDPNDGPPDLKRKCDTKEVPVLPFPSPSKQDGSAGSVDGERPEDGDAKN